MDERVLDESRVNQIFGLHAAHFLYRFQNRAHVGDISCAYFDCMITLLRKDADTIATVLR